MSISDCIEAIEADITTLDVDVIVNAANQALMPGDGVDGAIRRAAGLQLDAALYRIGGLEPGTAVITPGFDLPARHIIHTAAPVWEGGPGRDAQEETFRACYRAVLKLAGENAIAGIAFPNIGTGAFGWPAKRAAEIAFEEVTAHLRKGSKLKRVVFCCFSKSDCARYDALIADLRD